MSDPPKLRAFAGMIRLPADLSAGIPAAWVAVDAIKHIDDSDIVHYDFRDGVWTELERLRGCWIDCRRVSDVTAESVLEVMAQAWTQRGGRS